MEKPKHERPEQPARGGSRGDQNEGSEQKSDLGAGENGEAKKSYNQILSEEVTEGLHAQQRSVPALAFSGLSAGLDIGFSVLLMSATMAAAGSHHHNLAYKLLVASTYSVGFIFVALGRSELFTEQTTLAVLPVLSGQSSFLSLLRLWGIVYAANIVGALGFAALLAHIGPEAGFAHRADFGRIAMRLVKPDGEALFVSGLLAGWLMGLLSWLVTAARDTISQIVIVWIVATAIGFAHLAHAIAGSVEVLTGLFAREGITWLDYGHFLFWATLGNAVGGTVFVALLKYSQALHDPRNAKQQPG